MQQQEVVRSEQRPIALRKKGRKDRFDPDGDLKDKLRDIIEDETKSYHDVLRYIDNEIKESTRTIAFNYKISCFLEDGAWALNRAVESVDGFSRQNDRETMSGKNPPAMIDVRFADGTRKKVPYGKIGLSTFGKDAFIEMKYDPPSRTLMLTGQCEKRFQRLMDSIVEKTKELVDTDSIYKGKAIKIISDDGTSPEFIDLSKIENLPLFLTEDAKFSTTPIEARIEHTERCARENIDLKFGALLCGDYGTGKTLYAFKLALKAIRNQWSFIYCPQPEKALFVIQIANMLSKNGKGVVVFLEDIDKILSERTNLTNQISVLMDGGETKKNNVITIFTTNHLERIDPTFIRGKRIGTIVTLTHPDTATAREMIGSYMVSETGASILEDDVTPAAELIEQEKIVPAFIAEILERVKAHRVYTNKQLVTCGEIIASIKSYRTQMEIAKVRTGGKPKAEQFVDLAKDLFVSRDPDVATRKDLLKIFTHIGYGVGGLKFD